MVIPERLSREPLIRVKPQSKEPVVDSYEVEAASDVAKWVETGGNAAICLAESSYVVVDVDTVEVARAVGEVLPESFTVSTGSGWFHYYFDCPEWSRNVELGGGSIRSDGWIAVVPPSTHPSGGSYSVMRDREIARIEPESLIELAERFGESDEGGHPEPPSEDRGDGRLDELDELIGHDGYRADVREILESSDPDHNRRLWLVGFLSDAVGLSESEIVRLIDQRNRWQDYKRGVTEEQVASVVGSSGGSR